AFPFNHGVVGGIMATGRNGAYAHHGKDLAILHASHVGYDKDSGHFGRYRRLQTHDCHLSSNCGQIQATLAWYQKEYAFASENTLLQKKGDAYFITIDKMLIQQEHNKGIFLDLAALIEPQKEGGGFVPVKVLSTAKVYPASATFIAFLKEDGYQWQEDKAVPIGSALTPDLFWFKREIDEGNPNEQNLFQYMPWIVTSSEPMLSAAEVNVQVEFDKSYRSIVREPAYKGRKLIYIAGLNIDYSPEEGQLFSNMQFVPWAVYIQDPDGSHRVLEQDELYDRLLSYSNENPYITDRDAALLKTSKK
ncbi:MAG: hypothetical protein KAG20_05615, partial [Cocleimonas sp.]|nr:hypothetical protein [Cocleimonas sp.]